MDITFGDRKLKKIFDSENRLYRRYGKENGRLIMRRMMVLYSAPTLADVPRQKPERCHQLRGGKKGHFSVDVKHPYRIIFEPNHNPVPKDEQGGIDLRRVTAITISKLEDYH